LIRHRFRIWESISKEWLAMIGLTIIIIVLFAAIFSNFLTPKDPMGQDLRKRLIPPFWSKEGSFDHLLGTDHLGRDILSRIIVGARMSMFVAFTSSFIGMFIGVSLGLMCGYYLGILDNVIMRIIDVQLAFPVILLVIAMIAAMGQGLINLILALGITSWIRYARIVRGETLSVKNRDFILAIQALGANEFRILTFHVLPNVTPSIIVMLTFELARVIISEAALSFLGLGVPLDIPSWGGMLSEGRNYLATSWWLSTFPGVTIVITVLGINIFGDWLRDFMEPRTYRR